MECYFFAELFANIIFFYILYYINGYQYNDCQNVRYMTKCQFIVYLLCTGCNNE